MFIEKALQAQAAGAVGLIIYDVDVKKSPHSSQQQQSTPSPPTGGAGSAQQQSSEPDAATQSPPPPPPPETHEQMPFAPFSMSGDGIHDGQIRIPLAFLVHADGIDLLELIRTAESAQDAAIVIAPETILSCMNM